MSTSSIKDNLAGQKFDKLLIVSFVGKDRWGKQVYFCRCDCGAEKRVFRSDLISGKTRSCGCLSRETARNRLTTHGLSGGAMHKIWGAMVARCENPNNKRFSSYGGRGIRVCQRWMDSFQAFVDDMGERPEGLSLDRIDNNGNYTPENCRWTSFSEQRKNQNRMQLLSVNGESNTIQYWSDRYGINYGTLFSRLKAGMTPEDAVSKPVRAMRSRP